MKAGAARDRTQAALVAWTGVGLVGFVFLPWYLAADKSLLESIGTAFGGADTASGLREAIRFGKPWLASASVALALCAAAAVARPPWRGRLAGLGAALGLLG
ncbi:MAG: iron ABC transporter permease, partial [Caldimonas sp.]